MQTRVSATVVGPGTATVTNVFHFTFEARWLVKVAGGPACGW